MDWKQFISQITGHIVWPFVAIVFFISFRNELRKVIQRLAKFKYKDIEIDFEKLKQQADEISAITPKPADIKDHPEFLTLEDQIMETAENSPPASILLAWSGVEIALASAVSRLAISAESPPNRSSHHNIEMLKKYGDLPKNYVELVNNLRRLRNKVAHPRGGFPEISQDGAFTYSKLAIDLMQFLNGMQRNG